jgi:murein DD-endopeptidase MepM/ murein hydrolase activator NlpD
LLTSHSLTDALSDVSYYADMAKSDAALADEIRAEQKNLAQIESNVQMASDANQQLVDLAVGRKRQLDDQNVQFAQAKAQLASLKAQLQTQLAQQQKAEAQLAKNKAALDATIRSNGVAMDELGAKIDDLIRREGGNGRIPSRYNGQLIWPMAGWITQDYGCTGITSEPRVGSCKHFHQGIDIATTCLAPVYAAGDGVIMFVGYNPLDRKPYQAWLVIIAHSTSMVTWYAHMTGKAPPGIREGATVKQGQLIGTENTTGRSTGCHLHWAVRVNGNFMNPRLFL